MADRYAYHGLFWFSPGEDIKVLDSLSGEELVEKTLDDFVDIIEIPPKTMSGNFRTAAQNQSVHVYCGFEPKGVIVQTTYPAWIIYAYGYTPIRIGGSTAGNVLDEDAYYPDSIIPNEIGFNCKSVTAAWSNRIAYYGASKDLNTFTTPANLNESLQIDVGFKPKTVAVRLRSSTMYVWLYMEEQPTYKYLRGEVSTYTDKAGNPIEVNNNGFTFTPKNSYQQNQDVVFFVA